MVHHLFLSRFLFQSLLFQFHPFIIIQNQLLFNSNKLNRLKQNLRTKLKKYKILYNPSTIIYEKMNCGAMDIRNPIPFRL